MKLSEKFVLRQVAGEYYIFPLGEDTPEGIFSLNETGLLLWQGLEAGEDRAALVARITAEYKVGAELAAADVEKFIAKLVALGCLEESE